MFDLRNIIREALKDYTEGVDVFTFPDIGGWKAYIGEVVMIYDDKEIPVARLGKNYAMAVGGTNEYGKHQLSYNDGTGDGKNWTDVVPWPKGTGEAYIKNAVRYVFMHRSQHMRPEIKEATSISHLVPTKTIKLKISDGWKAKRFEGKTPYWVIFVNHKDIVPDYNKWMGNITDKGELEWRDEERGTIKENGRKDLANNPERTAQYIWLQTQTPIKESEGEYEFRQKEPAIGKIERFKDIGGWFTKTKRFESNAMDVIEIFAPVKYHPQYGYQKGKLSRQGQTGKFWLKGESDKIWLSYMDWENKRHRIPWKSFNDIKNAVRFVFLQNQKPNA